MVRSQWVADDFQNMFVRTTLGGRRMLTDWGLVLACARLAIAASHIWCMTVTTLRVFVGPPRNPPLGTSWFLGSCSILVDVDGICSDYSVLNPLPRKPFWGFLGGRFKAPRNPPEFWFSP